MPYESPVRASVPTSAIYLGFNTATAYSALRESQGVFRRHFFVHSGGPPRPAARSRFLDKVVTLPLPSGEGLYRAGPGSPALRDYGRRLLGLIDDIGPSVIYPSAAADVIALAAVREQLHPANCLVCLPSDEAIEVAGDKWRSVAAARAAGFRTPQTVLLSEEVRARDVMAAIGLPLVLKHRYSSGTADVRVLCEPAAVDAALDRLDEPTQWLVQEYVPGSVEESAQALYDLEGHLLGTWALRKLRYVHPSMSTCVQVVRRPVLEASLARVGTDLGVRGPFSAQVKIDVRDGMPTFIEFTCRYGNNVRLQSPMAWRNGGSLFLGPLRLASGQVGLRAGATALSVLEEPFVVRNYLKARRRGDVLPDNPVPSPTDFLRGIVATHLRRRTVDWISHAAVDDIRVAAAYLRVLPRVARRMLDTDIPWGDHHATGSRSRVHAHEGAHR